MNRTVPTYRLYREKSDESGDFWIHCETIPERTHLHNWHIAEHRHDAFFQIFLLTAGGGEIITPEGPRTMQAPCAVFIPPGAIHGFSYRHDVDGLVVTALADRLHSLVAADRNIATFASAIKIVPLDAENQEASYVVDCIKRLHAELHGAAPSRLLLLEPLVTGAVVSLARVSGIEASGGTDDANRLRLEMLTTLIAANFRMHKSSDFYAGALGVSPTHLNRILRDATGLSLLGLISMHIMEAARRDLVFTPTPVQAIGYSLGFSDPAYFSRFFRKQAGMSPAVFRDTERRKLTVQGNS